MSSAGLLWYYRRRRDMQSEGDTWTVVKATRPSHHKAKKKVNHAVMSLLTSPPHDSGSSSSSSGKSVSDMERDVLSTMRRLQYTAYYECLAQRVVKTLMGNNYSASSNTTVSTTDEKKTAEDREKIVALGIGSISTSTNSLWQFALLILLSQAMKEAAQRTQARTSSSSSAEESSLDDQVVVSDGSNDPKLPKSGIVIEYFDPIANEVDQELCMRFGVTLIRDNHKGFYSSNIGSTEKKVLYYMPHCPYRLYCNILWSNWEVLDHICILGNSFESYSFRRIYMYGNSDERTGNTKSDKKKKKRAQASNQREDLDKMTEVEDKTDLVMRFLPFVQEQKLWPLSAVEVGGVVAKKDGDKEYVHFLEGAFSDLSLMQFSSMAVKESLKAHFIELLQSRPTEDSMREATKTDVEIF